MAERLYSFKFYLLSVLSIIFIVLLFFFLLNAKFFLSDELTIIITPGAGRIFLETGEQRTVTLSVKNDNFRVCKTSCVLSTIFPEGSKTESSHHLSHGETIYHDIPIETPSYGHGHLFYTVVARCRNIESFFCATDGTERMNSAIIQATYSLSTTDEILKAQTKESIEHLIGLFEAQEDAYSQLIALGPAIPPDLAIPIVPEKELLEKIALWSEERYSQIDQENISQRLPT